MEQLKASLKEIADERNQLSDSFKSVQAEWKILKQRTANNQEHQQCDKMEKDLTRQLNEVLVRNDELADICNKLEEATKQMDSELDTAYAQIHTLEGRPSPEEVNTKVDRRQRGKGRHLQVNDARTS